MTKTNLLFKKARKDSGLSQTKLSELIGLNSPQYVSNWERGLCNPPLKSLKKLCEILKIDHDLVVKTLLIDYRNKIRGVLK